MAKEYANLTGEETVVDLYAGIGTIGMYMANDAKHVYSIEINEQAVKDARENAELNKVENISFFQGGAEKMLPEINRIGIKPDILVVDPPRRGFEEGLLEEIIDISPEKIVYISCNPSTLSRDLSRLEENGYEAIKCQPVDMFPKTVHVETVAILVKE